MADVHDKATRSYNMSKIRGKNTKPEMIVRRFLHANGFRYRLYRKDLPGRPDIVLPKYKAVIFVNGCFWHGHKKCRYFSLPTSNAEWWKSKIENNQKRDRANANMLKQTGWTVIHVWECNLKPQKVLQTLNTLKSKLFTLTVD